MTMPDVVQNVETQYWDDLRNGDPAALSWLYKRYFKVLYNYGKKFNAEDQALEDAIHDLFVDLWRFRENLSATTSVRFYLYRSLRRRIVRNDNGRDLFVSDGEISESLLRSVPSFEYETIEKEGTDRRVNHLKKLLNDLSPRQYEAMILRFYDEMSFEEIGGILNVNEQSARNLVQRGVTQLRQYSKLILTLVTVLAC